MQKNWIIGAGLIVFVAIIASGIYLARGPQSSTSTSTTTTTDRPLKTYYDQRYGIAFNFPDNYDVQEHDSTEGTKHHTIVIGDKEALANVPQESEGPPVITIDIFNNPKKAIAESWVKSENLSNYKLSPDGTLTPTNVAGENALAYGWDGLYRSTSIVFAHKDKIYMMSAGSGAPEDQLNKDFAKVVASVQFDP